MLESRSPESGPSGPPPRFPDNSPTDVASTSVGIPDKADDMRALHWPLALIAALVLGSCAAETQVPRAQPPPPAAAGEAPANDEDGERPSPSSGQDSVEGESGEQPGGPAPASEASVEAREDTQPREPTASPPAGSVTAHEQSAPRPAREPQTWAVFDSQRAMEATSHFKAAQAALEREIEALRTEFEATQEELRERREALEAQKALSRSEAVAEKEAELRREEQALMQRFELSREELLLYETKLRQQLFRRLEFAVQIVAVEGGNTFVIASGRVLYHIPNIDITDRVIEVYGLRFGDDPIDLEKVELQRSSR